jgi:putative hydrolase of the HAD superfamily
MKARAIFFDVGGTLLHPEWERVASLLGAPDAAPRLLEAEPRARRAIAGRLASHHPADWRTLMREFVSQAGLDAGESVLDMLWREHLESNFWRRPDPQALSVIAALRAAGFLVSVISNSEGKVRELLDETGFAGLFPVVVDSGIEGISKPAPGIFHLGCQRLGVSPAESLYLGDIFSIDIVGALGAGLSAALLDPNDEYLHEMPPGSFRVRSLAEFAATLGV